MYFLTVYNEGDTLVLFNLFEMVDGLQLPLQQEIE
jgi:hypothetical protein